MVEFAIVAPIFIVLLLAIVEGGRFVFYYSMLSSATREGARYAIVHGSNSSCPSGPMPGGVANPCDEAGAKVKQAVRDAAIGLAGAGDFDTLDVDWPVSNARGEKVTITVRYVYSAIVPLLPAITIGAESTLVINN